MDIFDYDTNTIFFQGKSYPFRVLTVRDFSYDIIVSTIDLERQLVTEDGEPFSPLSEWLDNHITFYFDTDDDLLKDNEILVKQIYS